MKGSLRLGKLFGIGVFLHWTFALLILFIIFSNYRKGHNATEIIWSVIFVCSIFITVLLHELGHALTARRYGIRTRDIILLPIGGLARLERMPEKPSEELVVALAGPAVNIVLAAVAAVFVFLSGSWNLTQALSEGVDASNFLINFLFVNFWLALFNMIPAFPMDGGRVLRALLSMRLQRHVATRIAARIGQALAVVFVLAGFFVNPFLVAIGFFIFIGAQSEAEYTQAQSLLKGYRVSEALMRQYQSIETDETLKTAVAMLLNGQYRNFLVTDKGVPVGTLSREGLIKGLAEAGENARIGGVMNARLLSVDASTSLETAYLKAREEKADMMIVTRDGKFEGTLDTENILEFIMVKGALSKV